MPGHVPCLRFLEGGYESTCEANRRPIDKMISIFSITRLVVFDCGGRGLDKGQYQHVHNVVDIGSWVVSFSDCEQHT